MKIEVRTDSVVISGYVNVPGRESRAIITPRGKVTEVIEQGAFKKAIEKAKTIVMKLDHEKIIASTENRTLELREDAIGLYAKAMVTDKETVNAARQGKLRGWSFNMRKIKDEIEERSENLPLRRVKEFEMDEVTIAFRKNPCYAATSVEIRAEDNEVEERALEMDVEMVEVHSYDDLKDRLEKL